MNSPVRAAWLAKQISILVMVEPGETQSSIRSALEDHAGSLDVRYAHTRDEALRQLRIHEPDLVLIAPSTAPGDFLVPLSELNVGSLRPFALVTDDGELANSVSDNPGYLDTIATAELTAAILSRTVIRLFREWQGISRIRDIELKLKESQESHRRATLLGRPVDWVWDTRNECLVYCSQEFATLHEMSIEEALRHFSSLASDHSVIYPDDFERWKRAKAEAVDGSLDVEYRIVVRSGLVKHIREISRFDVDENNEEYIQFGSVRDVTETKVAEQALLESNERYERLYHETPSMFFTIDALGKLLSSNTFGARHLGYEPAELVNKPFETLVHESDTELTKSSLRKTLASPGHVHHWELRLIRKDGQSIWVRKTARAIAQVNGDNQIFLVGEDVTETRKLSEQLSYYASHDPLTKLLNRREFDLRLKRILETTRSDDSEHALCYLDLDQFKVVNDNCGHAAGDELLRQVADLLTSCMRKRDTLARLGGDEFGILMEHCNQSQAHRVAENVRRKIESFCFAWENRVFSIGVSIGLVPIANTGLGSVDILKQADAACYAAKDSGRNRIHVYLEEDSTLVRRQGEMEMIEQLHRALQQDRLELYQQDIVALDSSTTDGAHYEVFVRMTDEAGRNVAPESLLAAAERYGVSPRLDRWIVSRLFRYLEDNPEQLSALSQCCINLSGLSLSDAGFQEFLLKLFEKSRVSPGKICFEITETAAIANLTGAANFIKNLRTLGCRFALDDFGKGLSSFAYLKTLPVDFLKIDGVFVRDVVTDPIDYGVVKSIHDIGKLMGLKTIAESVESDAILQKMKLIGVDYVQGFELSNPVLLV